jgi:hypothetical protein
MSGIVCYVFDIGRWRHFGLPTQAPLIHHIARPGYRPGNPFSAAEGHDLRRLGKARRKRRSGRRFARFLPF